MPTRYWASASGGPVNRTRVWMAFCGSLPRSTDARAPDVRSPVRDAAKDAAWRQLVSMKGAIGW